MVWGLLETQTRGSGKKFPSKRAEIDFAAALDSRREFIDVPSGVRAVWKTEQ
jgi:hypothetical protein